MYDCSRHNKTCGAMNACALLAVKLAAHGHSRVTTLRSDGPLILRQSLAKETEPLVHRRRDVARVAMAAGTAGPLGGDAYTLDVQVGAGSTLVLTEVSAMLVLPGISGRQSSMSVTIRVEDGATLVWWPEPIIAAWRCNHRHEVRIELAAGARLIMREEMILGRHRELPGNMTNRLRITRDGTALYDQRLTVGSAAAGWESAAVLNKNRAVGSVIAIDPIWQEDTPPATAYAENAAITTLPGPGVMISAVAADSLTLRRLLIRGLNQLGPLWAI